MTRMQPAASTAMNDMLSEMRQNNPAELAILTPGKRFLLALVFVAACLAHAHLQQTYSAS